MLLSNILYHPLELQHRRVEWRNYFLVIALFVACNLLLHYSVNLFLGFTDYELKRAVTLDEATSLKFILSACLFAPIAEELIFRLPLVVNKLHLVISSGLLTYCLYSKYNLEGAYQVSSINLLALIVSLLIPLLILGSDRIATPIIKFIKYRYSLFFYTLLISFGLLHMMRYDDVPFRIYLLSPIIMLPHIFMGYVSSYFRLKYGLVFSIMFHIMNNCLPMLGLLGYKIWFQ